MAGDFCWSAIALPLFVGAGLSFLVECLLKPQSIPFWKRHTATFSIHLGLWLLLFAFVLMVFRRPWFATIIELAFLLLVVQVNNAKFYSLREPFIFQDFEYFTDALKHPRLYLPFLGMGRALIIAVGFGVALFAGLTLEPSLTLWMPITEFFLMIFVMVILSCALAWLGARQKLTVTFEPETDLQQLGLLASLWRYGEEERGSYSIPSPYDFVEPAPIALAELPKLVVIQSESFFDARRLFSGIRQEVLHEFDILKTNAAYQGQVEVPAWGANTVRTEFAFLSGLVADSLGVHRFNPYRKLAHRGIPTLAGFLKSLGYRTVCVHPYQANFYARDRVFPLLGFDEFIDIESFKGIEKTGPYIGDVALAEKVCALLEASSAQPIFVFIITMENHGPLHLEKVLESDVERLYSNPPPAECDDLTIYLRHLSNADLMAGMLRNRLETLPGNSWLCWYGDHVPIMPKVYAEMGKPEGQTDYFIWEKGACSGKENQLDIKIENLGCLLLRKMGLLSYLN